MSSVSRPPELDLPYPPHTSRAAGDSKKGGTVGTLPAVTTARNRAPPPTGSDGVLLSLKERREQRRPKPSPRHTLIKSIAEEQKINDSIEEIRRKRHEAQQLALIRKKRRTHQAEESVATKLRLRLAAEEELKKAILDRAKVVGCTGRVVGGQHLSPGYTSTVSTDSSGRCDTMRSLAVSPSCGISCGSKAVIGEAPFRPTLPPLAVIGAQQCLRQLDGRSDDWSVQLA